MLKAGTITLASALQIGFITLTVVVWTVLAVDSWQMDQTERVRPRDDITPALLDLQKRQHRARVEWCRIWIDDGDRQALCLRDALMAYQQAVE